MDEKPEYCTDYTDQFFQDDWSYTTTSWSWRTELLSNDAFFETDPARGEMYTV